MINPRFSKVNLRLLTSVLMPKSVCTLGDDLIHFRYYNNGIIIEAFANFESLRDATVSGVEFSEYPDIETWLYHNASDDQNLFMGSSGEFSLIYQVDKKFHSKEFGLEGDIMKLSVKDNVLSFSKLTDIQTLVSDGLDGIISLR